MKMYSENSLVSIIMSVYNGEKYIQEAINSVLFQAYQNWELLVINDGSIDNTEDIILSYNDSRIVYFKQENKGVSAARNVGLDNMLGDYFCFLDADDVFPPKSIQSRLKIFKEDTAIQFVDGKVEVCNGELSRVIRSWEPKFHGNPIVDLVSLTGKSFLGLTWMMQRNPDKKYGFMEGLTHGEDLLFYIQLAKEGGAYSFTKEVVLHYRTGNVSAMSNLKGLEIGYWKIYDHLVLMDEVNPALLNQYKKKVKRIMTKSYLAKFEIFNALRVVMR